MNNHLIPAQADQKTPGSGPVNAGKEQEMLRKQLEDVMHEISESDNPMPEELEELKEQ